MNYKKWMGVLAWLAASPSFAHVVLTEKEAVAGTYHRAVFAVGHGCKGDATTRLTVLIPPEFEGAKPMPKAGWTIETKTEALAKPRVSHGKTVTQDVASITWLGGDLPDAYYDEFTVFGKLSDASEANMLAFKVVQECGNARVEWFDSNTQSSTPAPTLKLTKPEHSEHHH